MARMSDMSRSIATLIWVGDDMTDVSAEDEEDIVETVSLFCIEGAEEEEEEGEEMQPAPAGGVTRRAGTGLGGEARAGVGEGWWRERRRKQKV
jgi:hypothetical protein